MSYEEIVERLPQELIKSGWLGYPGASEAELATAEIRLATRLPPSYRAFLYASNGWRFPSVSIFDLLPVAGIAWFAERNQDWVDAYVGPSAGTPPISDEEYFVYGEKHDSCKFRTEYLSTALQVSEAGDSAVLLLNPKIVTPDGEWETWFFANWLPGAVRYRSFAEWLVAERRSCRKQLKPLPAAQVRRHVAVKRPVTVRKAQAAARSGQTEVARESLESFAAKGDDSAAASLAELYAFLGRWEQVIPNAGRLIANPTAVYAGNVFNDMIELLGCAGRRLGQWKHVVEVVVAALKVNDSRDCPGQGEWGRARHDKILRNLLQYSERQGEPPHELLAIFGVPYCMAAMSAQERENWYRNAVRAVDSVRPDLKRSPHAKAEYFFSLAMGLLEDEALGLYEAHGATFVMAWQAAEYVAGIHVRRGHPETAWATLKPNLSKWWPVDNAQVAPVSLLTNENLSRIMAPDRCQLVLSTARGPEGAKAGNGARP